MLPSLNGEPYKVVPNSNRRLHIAGEQPHTTHSHTCTPHGMHHTYGIARTSIPTRNIRRAKLTVSTVALGAAMGATLGEACLAGADERCARGFHSVGGGSGGCGSCCHICSAGRLGGHTSRLEQTNEGGEAIVELRLG